MPRRVFSDYFRHTPALLRVDVRKPQKYQTLPPGEGDRRLPVSENAAGDQPLGIYEVVFKLRPNSAQSLDFFCRREVNFSCAFTHPETAPIDNRSSNIQWTLIFCYNKIHFLKIDCQSFEFGGRQCSQCSVERYSHQSGMGHIFNHVHVGH